MPCSRRHRRRIAVDGYSPRRGEDVAAQSDAVAADYFRTLRLDVIAGRAFDGRDSDSGAPVAIVNRTFAERFWGGAQPAVGKRIRVAGGAWRTVVGVVLDVKYIRLNESPRPYFYLPFEQQYWPVTNVYARGRADTATLVNRMRTHVEALDSDVQTAATSLADAMRVGSLLFFQITATMLFVFGAAGMTLAAVGTYALVSYTVTQTTREIGIRMALGATALSVMRAFLGRELRLGAIGAAVGLIATIAASRTLVSVLPNALFGVSATDGRSLVGALAIVLGGVAAATLLPAWRAARTNPLIALRHQ